MLLIKKLPQAFVASHLNHWNAPRAGLPGLSTAAVKGLLGLPGWRWSRRQVVMNTGVFRKVL